MTVRRMDAAFEELKWDGEATLGRDFVRGYMASRDPETLGTIYCFVCDEQSVRRISPPLGYDELQEFARRYLGRCLREDPQTDDFMSQRSLTRQGAAWDIVRWYIRLLKSEPSETGALALWRGWLAEVYRGGDERLRYDIICSVLEHLFASAAARRTFADWRDDRDLDAAYRAALPARSPAHGLRVIRSIADLGESAAASR